MDKIKTIFRNIRPGLSKVQKCKSLSLRDSKVQKIFKKQGFTLVELIIVIAIIAVLAVAAFMMLTKWLGKSRDSRRLGDLGTISRGLTVGYSDTDDGINMYPGIMHQDDKIGLMSGSEVVGYQGRVDMEVVKGASMQKVPLDPSDQNEYTYLVTQNRQKFQVLGMLEDGTEVSLLNDVFALDYSKRYPTTKGFELGVLLQQDTNLPIQYVENLGFTGIDLTSSGEIDNYKAIVKDDDVRLGTGAATAPIVKEEIIEISSGGIEGGEEIISNPIDGACGTDNGKDLDSTPTNLCSSGNPSSVTDGGAGATYEWTCDGIDGGIQVSCSANHMVGKTVLMVHSDTAFGDVSDNFESSSINTSNWSISSNNSAVSIENGRLKSVLDSTKTTPVNGDLRSRYRLVGDFDIEVEIDASEIVADSTYIAQSQIRLNSGGYAYTLGNHKGAENRHYFRSSTCSYRQDNTYYNDITTYRFVRNGSSLYAYIKNDNTPSKDRYLYKTCNSFGTDIARVSLNFYANVGTNQIQPTYFDNFKINYGKIVSNSFIDSSSSEHTITPKGAVHHSDTINSVVGDTSMYFDGDGDYLEIADSEDFDFGLEDFTIDFRANPTSTDTNVLYAKRTNSSSVDGIVIALVNGNYVIYFTSAGVSWDIAQKVTIGSVNIGVWTRLTIVRNNNNIKLYYNGVLSDTITTDKAIYDGGESVTIGSDKGSYGFNGYIDEFKIIKGEAVTP